MALFFNGRLYTSPAVATRVDDSAMFNRNPGVGNVLAILGAADGGEPKVPLAFGSPNEAAAVLRGGPLLDAVARAFAASPETPGPSTVIAMRVQPATRSALTLLNAASSPVITLASQVWGALANRVLVTISNGTTRGKRIRTRLDGVEHDADNVGRQVLSILYTGAAVTATVTISATGITLAAPEGSALPEIPFTDAPTIGTLAERLSLVTDWTATVLDAASEHPTAGALDFVTAGSAKTEPLIVTADLQAIVEHFNSAAEPLVTATKVAGAGTVPVNVSAYMTGGTTGTASNQDWGDAFAALQQADVQWVVPASDSESIHAMAAAHATLCSNVLNLERRAIVGMALNTTDAAALLSARSLNSDRVSLCHIGVYDFDTAGVLRLYPAYVTAAMVAGGFAGLNPGNAMTNKALAVRGVERKLRNPTDTDALLKGGVMPIEQTATGVRVTQSVTTWLTNANFNKREASVGAAVDYLSRSIRAALQPLIGTKNGPGALAQAVSRTRATLDVLAAPEPQGIGVLVGDAENPPYRKIRVQADGDVLRVEFEASPVIPVNYIPITIFAVPYSGTANG